MKLVSGVLVDRINRTKPWIVWGYGLAGFSRPLMLTSPLMGIILVSGLAIAGYIYHRLELRTFRLKCIYQ